MRDVYTGWIRNKALDAPPRTLGDSLASSVLALRRLRTRFNKIPLDSNDFILSAVSKQK